MGVQRGERGGSGPDRAGGIEDAAPVAESRVDGEVNPRQSHLRDSWGRHRARVSFTRYEALAVAKCLSR